MKKLKLGILYKNSKIVNHRSALKVFLNPILRYFGFCIATKFENNLLGGICLIKTEKINKIKWDFNNHNDFDLIIFKRIII